MSRFLTPLDLRDTDGRDWILLAPLVFERTNGERLVVPAGTHTDFASIPRLFWRLYPPTGRYNEAAVIHDYIYRNGLLPRREADGLFYDAMKSLGVFLPTRYTMWLAVRIFGWFAYKSTR